MSKPDPLDQLTAFRIDVAEERRGRDLDAIRAELDRRPPRSTAPRRWTLAVVVAVMIVGPAAAVASDGAAPGDLLFPIKQLTEPIVQLFDRDVVAEHRVEEVAVLIDRRAEDSLIEERIEIARRTLAESDTPDLEQSLDRIVDRWENDRTDTPPPVTDVVPDTTDFSGPTRETIDRTSDTRDDVPTTSTAADRSRDTAPPSDQATTTTTIATTTTTATDGDGAPSDGDRSRDRP